MITKEWTPFSSKVKAFLKLSFIFLGRNQPIKYFFENSTLINAYLAKKKPKISKNASSLLL